jgi:hypothetical protein
MHSDHVSGLESLRDHCGRIKQVVLPYLQPAEILLLIAEYLSEDEGNAPADDFVSMLRDPDKYFGDESEVSFVINKHDEQSRHDASGGGEFGWSGPKYGHRRSHDQSYDSKLWSFRFFHEPISRALLDRFEAILEASGIDPSSYDIDIVEHASRLKDAYVAVRGRGHLNLTSLLCLHRPLVDVAECDESCDVCPACAMAGTFLTGDANFNRCLESCEKHFSPPELNSVCWASVPHHGSSYNWHDALFCMLGNCMDWICSCGYTNRYRHPHKKVMTSFFRNPPEMHSCTECVDFDYQMTV